MKKLFSLLLFVATVSVATAQEGMDKFWNFFDENKYEEAISQLEQIADKNQTNEDVWALLTLLYSNEGESEKSFEAMQKLYGFTSHKNEYLRVFWNSTAVSVFPKSQADERIEFLESLIASPEIDGSLKANANGRIANYYYGIGDFDEYWSYLNQIGNINKWSVVGVFENISASGFNKEYPEIIENPTSSASFINKHDAPVHWFESNLFQVGEWNRTVYHFNTDNSIVFAQTFIESPSDQNCELRLGTSGSAKVWLNDKLVMSEEEEYNNGIDTYRSQVQLKKGWNRVLIQLGTSEISSQNFMLRMTDAKGTPLQGLTHNPKHQAYTKQSGEDIKRLETDAIVLFNDKIEKDKGLLTNYLLLSRYYLDNGLTNDAHVLLMEAKEIAPNSSLVLWKLMELYLRENNETELGAAAEKMKVIDPENELSLKLEYNEALNNEKFDEATELHEEMLRIFGDSPDMLLQEIELEGAKGNNQRVIDLAEKGYKLYPMSETFVQYKYTIESSVNQNLTGALKVLKKYLKKNYSSSIQTLYAQAYASLNNVGKFFEEYGKILELKPYQYGTITDLASLYSQINQKETALSYYDRAIKLAPFVGESYAAKGEIYVDMDRTSEAIEQFKLAIKYDPTDFVSRERLRELEGDISYFELFEENDYEKLYKEAPSKEDYPEDNSIIIYKDKQVVIHDKGAVEERHELLVKVFDKAGVDTWKEYSVPQNRSQYVLLEKAEVLKSDGSKNIAETAGGYVVFTNLEPGDAVYISYKIQNYYQGSLADHYWGSDYFDYFIPSERIQLSVLYNEDKTPIKFHTANGDIEKKVKPSGDGMTLVTYKTVSNESIKDESFMPALTDVGRVLHYSTMPDWKFVSDWYSDLAATKAKVDFEVKHLVKELFPDGHEGVSEEQKIKTIYDYIVNEIRYSSISFRQSGLIPQKASDVITTKIGDCKDVSTLFVALCEEVDVDANLVLVNTRNKGQYAMELPSIEFNHCIAKVNLNNEERFVELTTDLYPFGTVSASLEGSFMLEIDTEKSDVKPQFIPQNKTAINAIYRKSEMTVEKNSFTVEKDCYKTGSLGGRMRLIYRDIGEEAKRKEMQEAISGDYPNIKLDKLKFDESLENNSDSVHYNYSYKVTNPFTKISDLEIFKVPMADNIEPIDFLSVDDRKFSLDFWDYFTYKEATEEITIHLPADKTLADVPKNVSINNDLIEYNLTFKENGKDLIVTRYIKFKKGSIPKDEFELLRTSMEEVISADNLQIGLK